MPSVLIVGCGVFGLSTALELVKKGYEVTAIDLYPIPSPRSAANDLNKIIRTEYGDKFYTKMAMEALKQWETDPLYKSAYYPVGRVTMSPTSPEHEHRIKYDKIAIDNLAELGHDVSRIKLIKSGHELGEMFPLFEKNKFGDNITARYNPDAGFGHASNSLKNVYEKCVKLGVKFIFGSAGDAVKVVDGNSILVKNGDVLTADKILLCCGAATGYLVDMENQLTATGLFVSHIRLSEEEYKKYRYLPVFFSAELGYFFPPDEDNHLLKIALTFSDVLNVITDPFNAEKTVSLPRFKDEFKQDTIPVNGPAYVKNLLNLMLPELADHEILNCKVCWVSDSTTHDFLIDKAPNTDNIYVATGDSGHGYKFLPNIGKYIVEKLEGTLDKDVEARWAWKSYPEWPKTFSARARTLHYDCKSLEFLKLDD